MEAAGPKAGGLPRDAAEADEERPASDKRLDGANPFGGTLFTERNWAIVDALRRVADEAHRGMARDQGGVGSPWCPRLTQACSDSKAPSGRCRFSVTGR